MLLVLLAVGVTSLSAIGNSPETSQALDRADALRQKGKWVQALSAYRQALTMPLNGCDQARIQLGTASVQWHAGNMLECKPHLTDCLLYTSPSPRDV